MASSSSDSELDEARRPAPVDPGMFVSHWDDDAGIEEEQQPHSSPCKEALWAAEHGELDTLRRLLATDAITTVTARDRDGYTPLHRACYNNHAILAQLIIEFGGDIEALTGEGWTPLHSAARWNSCRCVRLLLRYGANVNARTHGGLTPLMLAASSTDCVDACFLLLCQPAVETATVNDSGDTAAVIAGRTAALRQLFQLADDYLCVD